jgi:hypothetical protein
VTKKPKTNPEPLVIEIDGKPHTVNIGDTLFYIAPTLDRPEQISPNSIEVHTTVVTYASSKRLVVESSWVLSGTTYDANSDYNAQSVFRHIFSVTREAALRDYIKATPKAVEGWQNKIRQRETNTRWAQEQLDAIEKGKS